ncbi:MAG: hypothetical protein GTO63_22700 [Anaerolineae bacterium]|nr:hypothetical protein [Anaerolineae bacterium]NIN96111.1 hypothetical protein [Anaerolineae bacterium]NIQ80531.1 hypothetical protein [Anaerolineae bacterium]
MSGRGSELVRENKALRRRVAEIEAIAAGLHQYVLELLLLVPDGALDSLGSELRYSGMERYKGGWKY